MSASKHDGLEVAAVQTVLLMLISTEEAGKLRTTEFVAESRAADGTFRHDLERRRKTGRTLAVVLLPGLLGAGDAKVGNHEAANTGCGARTRTSRRLVANLAANASSRARIWGDGGRVVVRLDLHELIELNLLETVGMALAVRLEHVGLEAFNDGGVILVRNKSSLAVLLVRILDHPEERILLALAVDDELSAKNLVAAVLGVHLTEHDELGVGRVALRRLEGVGKILHLRLGDGKAKLNVRLANCLDAAAKHVELAAGLGRQNVKEIVKVEIHAFGHAVEKRRKRRLHLFETCRESRCTGTAHREADCALNTLDALHAAVLEDIRCLGGPR